MKTLKQILTYLIWTAIALLLGIGYMRILLGANDAPKEGLWYLFHIFYNYGLIHLGLRIGGIIAILFIILDTFYLKKKLINNKIKSTLTRLLSLLVITILVGGIHYILEKVIDII
ncbi:hypothetical protein ABW636_17330 [Aquimarina sp. 2201CG1-2-11]|uniref:hypothetical protein n=1 Tax=Aquimarina discodermiae TaxID=3231043 RepID=UPI00346225D2